jgi:hypothetical protein
MEYTLELANLLARHRFRRHSLSKNQAGHFQMVAQLNRETIDILLDTGASNTVVDVAYCQRHNVPMRESGRTGGGTGGITLPIFILEEPTLTLDGALLRSSCIFAIDLSHVNHGLTLKGATPIHAVLGADILLRQQAVIDYATKSLYLKHEIANQAAEPTPLIIMPAAMPNHSQDPTPALGMPLTGQEPRHG